MDLHLVPGAEPTAAESAALDSVLGPARDGWDGGARLAGSAGQHGQLRPRRTRAAAPAPAGALGAAGADRLDQPGRAERALPPADVAAGRRLRRRHVLRDARRRAAPAARRPRLRGHRVPLRRLGRPDRPARGAVRRRGRAVRRRLDDVVSEPLPRPVRPRAGRAGRRCGRRAARAHARAHDRRCACSTCSPAASPARRR